MLFIFAFNTIVNPALAILTGAPTTVAWEIIQTPPAVALKQLKPCLCNQKQKHI